MFKKFLFCLVLLTFSCCQEEIKKENLIGNVITLEEQMQKMNISQLDRGYGFKSDIHSEIATTPKNHDNSGKISKLEYLYNTMVLIDKETKYAIRLIDQIKMELLKMTNENVSKVKNHDPATIIWEKYDPEKNELKPIKFNLKAIKNKLNSGFINTYFIGDSPLQPSAKGIQLWNTINDYRNSVVSILGSFDPFEHKFTINPKNINNFSNEVDLEKKVRQMVENSSINHKEITQVLIDLYTDMTKQNPTKSDEGRVHWIHATFHDASLVGAIASLTSLQQDILSTRTLALAHLMCYVNICGYGFDTIIPVAKGPSTGYVGEEVQVKVIMAAFDSYNEPLITTTYSNATIKYPKNGTGIVSFVPQKGLQTIRGTVSIKNKSGVAKTEDWEWTINILEKN